MVLEFLEGKTLREHMIGRRLEVSQIVDLAIQIASRLEAAHSKGIIHRDIKSSNIFVISRSGCASWPKLKLAASCPISLTPHSPTCSKNWK